MSDESNDLLGNLQSSITAAELDRHRNRVTAERKHGLGYDVHGEMAELRDYLSLPDGTHAAEVVARAKLVAEWPSCFDLMSPDSETEIVERTAEQVARVRVPDPAPRQPGLSRDEIAKMAHDAFYESEPVPGDTWANPWPVFADRLLARMAGIAPTGAPPADLPATLASVDDVRRVCEAAGLTSHENEYEEPCWGTDDDWFVQVEAVHAELDLSTVSVYRCGTDDEVAVISHAAPAALLWHAIQAARSAS